MCCLPGCQSENACLDDFLFVFLHSEMLQHPLVFPPRRCQIQRRGQPPVVRRDGERTLMSQGLWVRLHQIHEQPLVEVLVLGHIDVVHCDGNDTLRRLTVTTVSPRTLNNNHLAHPLQHGMVFEVLISLPVQANRIIIRSLWKRWTVLSLGHTCEVHC